MNNKKTLAAKHLSAAAAAQPPQTRCRRIHRATVATLLPALLFALDTPASHAAEADSDAIRVTTQPLAELQFQPAFSSSATARSLNNSMLSAEISARIDAIKVQVGATVKRGDNLLRFNCRQYNYALRDARARLDLARKEAARASKLKQSSNIAEQNYNQTQTELSRAKIAHQQQQLAVSHCNLKAPFDGVVVQRLASLGELAAPGTPLLELLDTRTLEVSAKLMPAQVQQLQHASQITFSTAGVSYAVTVARIVPVIDPVARNQEVRLQFGKNRPLPGAAGRLRWQLETPHIPAALLQERDDVIGFFIIKDDKAAFSAVVATHNSQPAPVDLPPETEVIINGRFGLASGDALQRMSGSAE